MEGNYLADFHGAIAAGVTTGERRKPSVLSLQIMIFALGALPHLVINRAERFLEFLAVVKKPIPRDPNKTPQGDPTTGATSLTGTRIQYVQYHPEKHHDHPAQLHEGKQSGAGI